MEICYWNSFQSRQHLIDFYDLNCDKPCRLWSPIKIFHHVIKNHWWHDAYQFNDVTYQTCKIYVEISSYLLRGKIEFHFKQAHKNQIYVLQLSDFYQLLQIASFNYLCSRADKVDVLDVKSLLSSILFQHDHKSRRLNGWANG